MDKTQHNPTIKSLALVSLIKLLRDRSMGWNPETESSAGVSTWFRHAADHLDADLPICDGVPDCPLYVLPAR